jgi:hypothetical protein
MKFIIGDYEQERCTGISTCCLECLKNEKYPHSGKAAFVQKAVFALIEQSACFVTFQAGNIPIFPVCL